MIRECVLFISFILSGYAQGAYIFYILIAILLAFRGCTCRTLCPRMYEQKRQGLRTGNETTTSTCILSTPVSYAMQE